MSSDVGIDQWLRERGYGLAEVKPRARAALEEAGLTRPGKQRMSLEKLPRAEEVLRARFALHCESPECQQYAEHSGRIPLRCDPRSTCERCGGSANQAAENALLEACRKHGVKKICIVGGSPAVREELEATLGRVLELRLVDGTERRTSERANRDLEWADLVLVWGASELHHKVSWLYTQGPPQHRRKVVLVAKRGIAALLSEAIAHIDRVSGGK
ncbi:MAG: hypothetical protein IRZ16_10020 [Myxococcaceae bacterium]|nr:hypothetical protein [Myxococcaceae bacterium]